MLTNISLRKPGHTYSLESPLKIQQEKSNKRQLEPEQLHHESAQVQATKLKRVPEFNFGSTPVKTPDYRFTAGGFSTPSPAPTTGFASHTTIPNIAPTITDRLTKDMGRVRIEDEVSRE
jgi:hypothetical protein